MDGVEEDEETLQLKLAAIEAKLKLKRLQNGREKSQVITPDTASHESRVRPSPIGRPAKGSTNVPASTEPRIEIPLSPSKSSAPSTAQRSPSRVLLGIDKGVKGNDISLRRAKSLQGDRKPYPHGSNIRASNEVKRRGEDSRYPRNTIASRHDHATKSFSNRMAESRLDQIGQAQKWEAIAKNRSTGFKMNDAEMKSFKEAAAEARAHQTQHCSKGQEPSPRTFSRDEILGSQNGPDNDRERSSAPPRERAEGTRSDEAKMPETGPFQNLKHKTSSEDDRTLLYDPYSQLYLSHRALPQSFLERTLSADTHTCIQLPQLLKQVKAPDYELPGLEEKDIVIVGVVASKSSPLDRRQSHNIASSANIANGKNEQDGKWDDGSQNQKKFMVLQICDLTWSVDLYLFGTALPRYHRIIPGTVVAILNPGVMPPRKGTEDTGAFGLTLHQGEDTVLEIGSARDLGFCSAIRKDGKHCQSWVNLTKTEICEWHLNAQIKKTQASRMGVNTGTNGIGSKVAGTKFKTLLNNQAQNSKTSNRLGKPPPQRMGYDRGSQSHYYLAPGSAVEKKMNVVERGEYFERSAAALLDLDVDDPFIAAGRLSRDTETRLKKRLLTQEKERDIAVQLGSTGWGGAGGEYLRRHAQQPLSSSATAPARRDAEFSDRSKKGQELEGEARDTTKAKKHKILGPELNASGKRAAADAVRLSPLKERKKRLRLVSAKKIGEADCDGGKGLVENDHESDLDIV